MAREILIADGNKAAHKAFEDIFSETDYNLVFSENGEDALLKMKLFKPALVIADITMPDKDGKELCQMLKEDPNLNKVPFVLLGGPFDEDIEAEKKQVRADGAITKPLQREPILRLVDGLLMAEPTEGTRGVEEEILDLQPMAEVTESVSSQGEEQIIDLLDFMEEPETKPKEVPPGVSRVAMNGEGVGESEEGGLVREEAIADLELPEDMGLPKTEEAIKTPEMERPGSESEILEEVDLKTEMAEMEGKIPSEKEMDKVSGIEDQYPGPLEGTWGPETEVVGAGEVTEEFPVKGMGDLSQDIAQEKGLEGTLAEQLEGLPVEGASEPETGALEAGEVMEELPTEGMGELPQDVLKERGLEEALSEEIEELPEDLLGEKELKKTRGEWKDTTDDGKAELEGLEELGKETTVLMEEEGVLEEALRELPGGALEEGKVEESLGGHVSMEELGGLEELGEKSELLREEEGALEEASRELPAEGLEERELERFPGGDLSTEEFEWQPREASQEMDLEGLAEKVLKEEDLQAFGKGGLEEEGLEGFPEEVFKEGELEKLAEEATRGQEKEEIPEGALAEAIEEFTGETVREGEETEVETSSERPVQETISGAVKELVEGMSAKILPQLTEAIAAAAAERIEKTVQKIVPEMAEEAIQKEIRRLEKIKKEEEFDT